MYCHGCVQTPKSTGLYHWSESNHSWVFGAALSSSTYYSMHLLTFGDGFKCLWPLGYNKKAIRVAILEYTLIMHSKCPEMKKSWDKLNWNLRCRTSMKQYKEIWYWSPWYIKQWDSKPHGGNLWHKYKCIPRHTSLKLSFKI